MYRAAQTAPADAREMAARVRANTSLLLCRFAYTMSHTISYGDDFARDLARQVDLRG